MSVGLQVVKAPFDQIVGQPTASRFLTASVQTNYRPQAYLFYGPSGSGRSEAAYLLARSLLCSEGGDDDCQDCQKVLRHSHPDLQELSPEGASGYLIGQIHDLSHSAALSPMLASRKVYIIQQADRMSVSFANAFLKLLEEPPPNVVFILICRNLATLLPTVRSRCQLVPFTAIPTEQAIALLVAEQSVPESLARLALAYSGGSLSAARDFIQSSSLQQQRRQLMSLLRGLSSFDSMDVLEAVRQLVISCKLPLDDLRIAQQRQLEENRETLSKTALNELEQGHKRELTALERASARWLIEGLRSWVRDILLVYCGLPELVVNYDEIETIQTGLLPNKPDMLARLMICLEASNEAEAHLDYNVSVQSIFEYLLFTLRDQLTGRL